MPKTKISNELYQYALTIGVKEHSVLKELRNETARLSNSMMQIPPEQGQFMALLAKIMNAKKYLDIGVFTGYSSLIMALNMCTDGLVYALDNNHDIVTVAEKFWKKANVEHKIKPIIGDALVSLAHLIATDSNSFDIIFIDANKSGYLEYYEYAYQLAKPGGLILIDNVFMRSQVLDDNPPQYVKIIKELNQLIYNDPRVDICVLPIADGLTLAYKKDNPV